MKNFLRYLYHDVKIGMKMVYVVAMESAINVQLWDWNPHVLVIVAGPVTNVIVLPKKYQTSNVQIRKLTRFVLEEVILNLNAYQEITQFETNLTEPSRALQNTQWFPRIGLFVVQAIILGPFRRNIEFLNSFHPYQHLSKSKIFKFIRSKKENL